MFQIVQIAHKEIYPKIPFRFLPLTDLEIELSKHIKIILQS